MQSYMAQRSYTMHEKQIELSKMREETQLLQSEVDKLNSPKTYTMELKTIAGSIRTNRLYKPKRPNNHGYKKLS